MIHMIYMAAGNSRRFGENKLITMRRGKYLFSYGLETLISVLRKEPKKRTLTVVTRFPEVLKETERLAVLTGGALRITAVNSPESVNGASFTIKRGIKAVESRYGNISEKDYLLIMVSDQPEILPDTVERMIEEAEESLPETLSLKYGDTPGNPCMFRGDLVPELKNLTGDKGGRVVVRNHTCSYIEAGSLSELRDIDEMKDLNT